MAGRDLPCRRALEASKVVAGAGIANFVVTLFAGPSQEGRGCLVPVFLGGERTCRIAPLPIASLSPGRGRRKSFPLEFRITLIARLTSQLASRSAGEYGKH